jgi:hypothetical protein
LIQKSEPAQLREDLMVRLRAEAQLGGNQILLELERHLFLHKNKLEIYQNIYEKTLRIRRNKTESYLFIK